MFAVVADQSQTQLTDLAHQFLEASVLRDPRLHLGNEILGNIDGMGLALLFVTEMVSGVQRPIPMTTAGRLATAFVDQIEAGSQDRLVRGTPLEPTVEHASDQGWVTGNTHTNLRSCR